MRILNQHKYWLHTTNMVIYDQYFRCDAELYDC